MALGENIHKLKNSDRTSFYVPGEVKGMSTPITSKRPEEREFVVESGASMHMLSKKELGSDEMETLRRSSNSTTVITANGEVQTNEEAQVFVHDLDLSVKVQILNDTPAVLSQGKLCEDHGYSHELVIGQKPRLTKDGTSIICKTENFVPLVVPGLSVNSESVSYSTSPSRDSLRREAEIASRKLVRPASSSFSGSVLQRSDEIASRRLVRSQETQNQNKTRDDKKNSDDPLADSPEWLEDFKENLVDTELPASAHSF